MTVVTDTVGLTIPEQLSILERDVHLLLEGFERRTGLGVTGVSLRKVDVTTCSSPRPLYALSGVRIEVGL